MYDSMRYYNGFFELLISNLIAMPLALTGELRPCVTLSYNFIQNLVQNILTCTERPETVIDPSKK